MFNVQSDPIYSLPHLYISGLNLSVASTKIIAISPGQCRDVNDVLDMPVGYQGLQGLTAPAVLPSGYRQPLFVNSAAVGANGLDAGSLAASSQYAIYLIGDSRGYKPVAGIMSLAAKAYPLMPLGYDSLRLLGFVATDSSSNFVFATSAPQMMKDALEYAMSPAVAELSGGNATSFTGVDLDSSIPLGTLPNVMAILAVTFIPASDGSYVQFRATNSGVSASVPTISAVAAGVAQTQYLSVVCGVNGSSHTSLDYLVSSSSDSVSFSVVGYSAAPFSAYPS